MFENYFYGMESDNDDIELDPKVTTNDETAVDDGEAGSDMETVDVTPSNSECEHNEVASAGGIATGDNQEDLEMDPVAATEAYLFKKFHMSSEEAEDLVQEITEAASDLPPVQVGEPEEEVDPDVAAGIVIMPTEDDAGDEPIEDSVVSPDDESTESYNPSYSTEKAYGYFKLKDFKKDETRRSNEHRLKYSSPKDFLNSELGKSKIKRLIDDAKDKDMTPATMKEVNDLKPTFFHKYIRGNYDSFPIFKYYTSNGVVFATWKCLSITGQAFSAVGLFKTKTGKITSIGYAISVPCGVNESAESYVDPLDNAIFANLF